MSLGNYKIEVHRSPELTDKMNRIGKYGLVRSGRMGELVWHYGYSKLFPVETGYKEPYWYQRIDNLRFERDPGEEYGDTVVVFKDGVLFAKLNRGTDYVVHHKQGSDDFLDIEIYKRNLINS